MMRTILATIAALLVVAAATGVASAEISAVFVQNPGCSIAGHTTYDLVITPEAEWTNSRLELTLDTGAIYQDSGFNQEYPQTGFWGMVPALEWDSFFAAPTDFAVPGFADQAGDGWTDVSVKRSWFDSVDMGSDSFIGARITVTEGAAGPFMVLLYDKTNPGQPVVYEGYIPEPATLSLLGAGLVGLVLRRRRS